MPQREFIADARTTLSSRSKPFSGNDLKFYRVNRQAHRSARPFAHPISTIPFLPCNDLTAGVGSIWRWLSRDRFRVLLVLIYRIYERDLDRQVRAYPVPHRLIPLIFYGNRRHGRKARLVDLHDIYMAGADKLDELLEWCITLKISCYYALGSFH